jgi:hypothetical protein
VTGYKRNIVRLLMLALGQATLTIGMTIFVFGSEMSRFDTGEPAPLRVRMASALVGVLAYPVLPLVAQLPVATRPSGFPGEHLLFLLNGLVWAAGMLALRRWWRRDRTTT